MRILFCLLSALVLSGCVSPQHLGFSTTQWEHMNPKARQAALVSYQNLKPKLARITIPVEAEGPGLSVYLMQGEARMPPFTESYPIQVAHVEINPGECKQVTLQAKSSDHSVKLGMCYNGERLSMDPSHVVADDIEGTVHFDYNPIWRRGFTYSDVKSTGYVRLQQANISIKLIPKLG